MNYSTDGAKPAEAKPVERFSSFHWSPEGATEFNQFLRPFGTVPIMGSTAPRVTLCSPVATSCGPLRGRCRRRPCLLLAHRADLPLAAFGALLLQDALEGRNDPAQVGPRLLQRAHGQRMRAIVTSQSGQSARDRNVSVLTDSAIAPIIETTVAAITLSSNTSWSRLMIQLK
jgi:hypothetical protein